MSAYRTALLPTPPPTHGGIFHLPRIRYDFGHQENTVITSIDGTLHSLHYFQTDVSLQILLRAVKILPSVVSYLVYPVRLSAPLRQSQVTLHNTPLYPSRMLLRRELKMDLWVDNAL